jgi:hypothetical protein
MMDFGATGSPNFAIATLGGKAMRPKSESWMQFFTTTAMTLIN